MRLLFNILKSAVTGRRAAATPAEIVIAAEALKRQGNECLGRGELDAAADYYREALDLDPNFAEALNNLGYVLKQQRRFLEAEATLSAALALNPDLGPAQFNRGVLALNRGELKLASACFDKAAQLMPTNADVYAHIANVQHQQGMFEEACDSLRKALELNPDDAESRWVLAMTQIPAMASAEQAPEVLRKDFLAELEELDKWFHPGRIGNGYQAVGSAQPFYLAYQEVSNKAVLERYGALCHKLMDHWPQWPTLTYSSPPRLATSGRVKVGFITSIGNPSVWLPITRGWIRHLDRDSFDVYVFALDTGEPGKADIAHAPAMEFVEGRASLSEWVEAILARQIEVLIFPEIGMTTMTTKLANLRLAPVQAVAWGHPETSGLPTIDYYLSAEYFENETSAEHYTERLISLPNLGCCCPRLGVTPIRPNLDAFGIDPTRPLLLSPGAPFKYAPEFDRVFVEIAKRIDRCQIVFFAESGKMHLVEKLRSRLQEVFRLEGLDFANHCIFVPFLDRAAFYGLMQRADLFLDTIGFSGFNTAMQAAECGLPIVTREGRFMRGRLASGILKRMGLSELVAATEEEYVALATKLVQDTPYAQSIRHRFEAARHLLFDDLEPVRALERFLIGLCRSSPQAPEEGEPTQKQTHAPKFVWQLLDEELHMQTLKPGNAPLGLLEMIEPAPRRVLDVGCFCGGSGRWLRHKFPDCKLIGIEKMEAAAAMAAEAYDKIISKPFEQIDFDAEGLVEASFDAVVAADVLEHLYNPWRALQRLKSLVAPNGAIYISLPNVRNLGLLSMLAGGQWQYAGAGLLDITHIRFFTRAQAVEMLEQTGWRVERLRLNPDPALATALQGRELSEIQSVDAGPLKLENLTLGDVEEFFALQFHIRAVPNEK